ncbi:MAG: GMC oxidoreductase [Myxococcota bacterium]
MQPAYDFDFIVIGSGFGGSVSAHRLTEKGYRVGVLEMGKRYRQDDFPETNWNARKFLWGPALKLHGFFRMSLFRHAWVLSGVGVGGGSLVYANTLLVPPDRVWTDDKWRHLEDWKSVMPRFYDTARQMLGVTTNPYLGEADKILQESAKEQGFGETFYPTEVGVFFGESGKTVPDPYFGGNGPPRSGCTLCGGCMVGCRYNAKNTLDKNYLYFAEKQGAQVIPETLAVDVKPLNGKEDGRDGYQIETVSATRWLKRKKIFRTRGVVFAGGVLGTVKLLAEARARGSLPNLSDQVGEFVRTNSESIIGVRMNDRKIDMSDGIAIGSGVHINADTHIEAVRYPKGSDALAGSSTLLTHGEPGLRRILAWLGQVISHPWKSLKAISPGGWAQSSIILLVMQTLDSHIRMRLVRSIFPPFRRKLQTHGPRIPTYIPAANRFAEKMGEQFGGTPLTALTEIIFNVPTTAHILGGAAMGANARDGVIDSHNRVFNYKNMYVCDGSMIGANLGVNPSLSITALSEHAMSAVRPAGETDWNESGRPS